MFIYCLDNPVSMVDPNGHDAIYVIVYEEDDGGLPVVGHGYLIIQDSSGKWYITEFTGTFPDKDTAEIDLREADMSLVQKMMDRENITNVDYFYVEGDFSESYQYAESLDGTNYGGYDLLDNNCAHYCKDILLRGKFQNVAVQGALSAYDVLTPVGMYYCMIDKLMEGIPGYQSQIELAKQEIAMFLIYEMLKGIAEHDMNHPGSRIMF